MWLFPLQLHIPVPGWQKCDFAIVAHPPEVFTWDAFHLIVVVKSDYLSYLSHLVSLNQSWLYFSELAFQQDVSTHRTASHWMFFFNTILEKSEYQQFLNHSNQPIWHQQQHRAHISPFWSFSWPVSAWFLCIAFLLHDSWLASFMNKQGYRCYIKVASEYIAI